MAGLKEPPAGLHAGSSRLRETSERAPRALVWDALNTSTVIVALALRAHGWSVDILANPQTRSCMVTTALGTIIPIASNADPAVDKVLADHPIDAVFRHADAHIPMMLERWKELPSQLVRHLPPRESLAIALSKDRSRAMVDALGLPVLPTIRCTSPAEVQQAVRDVAGRGHDAIVKGEGGSSGNLVRVVRRDEALR